MFPAVVLLCALGCATSSSRTTFVDETADGGLSPPVLDGGGVFTTDGAEASLDLGKDGDLFVHDLRDLYRFAPKQRTLTKIGAFDCFSGLLESTADSGS